MTNWRKKTFFRHMKESDRAIGYLSLLALIALFAGIAHGMFEAHEHAAYMACVDFTELGSLQSEDPVVVCGYTVDTTIKASTDALNAKNK
jgi:hypothetical protein